MTEFNLYTKNTICAINKGGVVATVLFILSFLNTASRNGNNDCADRNLSVFSSGHCFQSIMAILRCTYLSKFHDVTTDGTLI